MSDRNEAESSAVVIESDGTVRLADLVLRHAVRDDVLPDELRRALLADGTVDGMTAALAEAIAAIEADHRKFDGAESAGLAATLDRLRVAMAEDLFPRAPQAAVALFGRFLRLDGGVFERSDDSDGLIGDVFRQAIADCGRACLSWPDRDPGALAELVFDLFVDNDRSLRDEIVPAFREALGEDGLDALEGLIRHRLGGLSGHRDGWLEAELIRALIEIADARGDLDGYIALHEQAGTEGSAVKDICERLADAGRLEEALDRAERAAGEAGMPDWQRAALDRTRVGILTRLGRIDEAQALRRALFARILSPTILDDYLAALPAGMRAAALADAVAVARGHEDVHGALDLLIAHDLDAAAALVRERTPDFNAQLYRVLRPAAERLSARHPLAAILLYRRLAEAVLDRAQAAAYDYVVKDLMMADRLSDAVEDWEGHPPSDAYRLRIAARHRRKHEFWERMRLAGADWRC